MVNVNKKEQKYRTPSWVQNVEQKLFIKPTVSSFLTHSLTHSLKFLTKKKCIYTETQEKLTFSFSYSYPNYFAIFSIDKTFSFKLIFTVAIFRISIE